MPCGDGETIQFCYRPSDEHYVFTVVAGGFEFDGRTFRRQVDVLDYIDETHEPAPEPAPRPIAGRIAAGRGPLPVYDDLMSSVFGRRS